MSLCMVCVRVCAMSMSVPEWSQQRTLAVLLYDSLVPLRQGLFLNLELFQQASAILLLQSPS